MKVIFMLDYELKTKWIAALRSGDYKQGQAVLRAEDNCFCCLGVLCDVIDSNRWEKESTEYVWRSHNDVLCDIDVPQAIIDIRKSDTLIKMNDVYDLSFNEIADWIETNL